MQEIIGWGSAMLILPTFGVQAYKQWKSRNEPAPPSALWFFALALSGAAGQVVYSWMLGNWVYFILNACLIVTDGFGLGLVIHRCWLKRQQDSQHGADTPEREPPAREETRWTTELDTRTSNPPTVPELSHARDET